MKRYICDRCGEEFETNLDCTEVEFGYNVLVNEKCVERDLCIACRRVILEMIDSKDGEE